MADPLLSSLPAGTVVISDPVTASFLGDAKRQHYLRPFFQREVTLSDVARELHLPLNLAHYWTQKLLHMGLVHETQRIPRKGRAVRYYRAAAPAFFLPFRATPAPTLETQLLEDQLIRQKRLAHAQAQSLSQLPAGHGLLFYCETSGAQAFRRVPVPGWTGEEAPLNTWLERPFTATAARQLRQELQALLDKYATLPQPEAEDGEMFLLHVGLAQLDD